MLSGAAHRVADAWTSAALRLTAPAWDALPHPPSRGMVSGPGHDPDRVLVAGNGSAVGWGVLDHALGLPGHLARAVAAITSRGVDLDVIAEPELGPTALLTRLPHSVLARYDAVVLTIGPNEARHLMSVATWTAQLGPLLDHLGTAPNAPSVVVVGAEEGVPPGGHALARRISVRAAELNAATRSLVAERPRVTYVDSVMPHPDPAAILDCDCPAVYDDAAHALAPALAAMLDLIPRQPVEDLDEAARPEIIERLRQRTLEADLELVKLVGAVRQLLDAADAVLVLVGVDMVEPIVSDAAANGPRPRAGSLSDVAIHHRGGLVIPDLSVDPRFRGRADVAEGPGFRSYAGHPVPFAGQNVAVLAVVDTRVREFTPSELALLRGFCLRAGELLQNAIAPATAS